MALFDPLISKYFTIILFVLSYIFIIFYYKKKHIIAWISVVLLLLVGVISITGAFQAINWNVIGIYVSMLFLSELFIESKVPDYLATWIVGKAGKVSVALLAVCFLAGILSTFLENVAVVLIVAPIALEISRKMKISPVSLLIGIAITANLQGVATMIGDPPSLLFAAHANLGFLDFFIFQGKPSLFFIVQVAAIAGITVLYFFFRHFKDPVNKFPPVKISNYAAPILLLLMVLCLSSSSFIHLPFASEFTVGIISVFFGLLALGWYYFNKRDDFIPVIKRVDWETAYFLVAIFILVDSLKVVNFMADIAHFINSITGSSLLVSFIVITVFSVIFSAFVDNVPFIAAMLPVTQIVAENLGASPYVLYFGLLIGTSVGGNITPIGASANIVACGILKKEGYDIKFWEFTKIGLPFTIVAVAVSSVFIWFFFG